MDALPLGARRTLHAPVGGSNLPPGRYPNGLRSQRGVPSPQMEVIMTVFSRRMLLASALLVGLAPGSALFAADQPKEIRIDWATYNPVSMVLKEKGLLEKEFARD